MEDELIEQDYQKDYFESVIRKYECRNALYMQKQHELKKRLETMERFLPAIMCYNMMQTKTEPIQPARAEYDSSPVKEEPIVNIRNETQPFKNSRDDRNLRSCNCNLCPLDPNYIIKNDSTKPPSTSFNARNDINMRSCFCNPCPISKDVSIIPESKFTQSEKPAQANENLNSNTYDLFKPDDIRCMNRIKELAKTERRLTEELTQLNRKERAYTDSIQQPIASPSKDSGRSGEGDFECEALKRINQQLECENRTLEEELENVKKEINHLHDTIEEPIKQELENEKCKCLTLEEKTHKRSTDIKAKEIARQNQTDFLKRQLQSANQNLHNLHIVNKRLKEELCMLNCKCNELQTDMINQKISEIHTVSRIVASRSKVPALSVIKPFFPPSRSSDTGGDLTNIARNLSKLIQDAKSCKNCKNAHMDMIDTVQYIKDLVDIVNVDEKILPIPDAESEIFCKCVDWRKLKEEIQMEEPTYELLSPKKIHPAVSTSSGPTDKTLQTYSPEKQRDKSSVVEAVVSIPSTATEKAPTPLPSKKEDRKRSAVEAAENVADALLQDIAYKRKDGVEETEFDEKTTDVSATQSGTEQLFAGVSELPTDTTEEGGGDITSEIDETEDFTMDVPVNEETAKPATSEDAKVIEAPKELTEEDQAEGESQAIPISGKEESITEETEESEVPKTDEGGTPEESNQPPDEEITVEGTLKPIGEEKEQVAEELTQVNKEENVASTAIDEKFHPVEVISDPNAKEDENVSLNEEVNLEQEFRDDTFKSIEAVSEEPAKGKEISIKLDEEVHSDEEFHDAIFKSAEVISEEAVLEEHEAPIAKDEIGPKDETEQMQELVISSKEPGAQEVTQEDEEKEKLVKETVTSLKPIEQSIEKLQIEYDRDDFVEPVIPSRESASLADTVKKTICKCVKRQQPTLCDCIEKGRAPTTVSGVPSKELHVKRILSDVLRKSLLKEDDFIAEGFTKMSKSVLNEVSNKPVQSKPSPIQKPGMKPSSKEPGKKTLSEEEINLIDKNSSMENKHLSKKSAEVLSSKVSKTITDSTKMLSPDTKASKMAEPVTKQGSEQHKVERSATKEPAFKSNITKPHSDSAIIPPRQFGPASREEGKRSLPLIITPEQASVFSTPNQRSIKSLSVGGPSKESAMTEKSSVLSENKTHKSNSDEDEPGTITAIIDTEGNVPLEAEIELLPKSSVEGMYVTTTVTSSGHVEVTTEGPTGVIETTLKVTKSGNLEVITGLTEYDQLSIDSVKENEINHSHNIPVEVIHHAISNVKGP